MTVKIGTRKKLGNAPTPIGNPDPADMFKFWGVPEPIPSSKPVDPAPDLFGNWSQRGQTPGQIFGLWGAADSAPPTGKPSALSKLAGKGQKVSGKSSAAPAQAGLTFADYLRMANEMGLGGDGTDYSALIAQLKANASEGDARLNAMYNQLRGSIEGDAPVISQNYDSAGGAIASNGAQAAAQTAQGYQQARDAQSQQLAALGIQDAAGVLASAGNLAGGDAAHANANIAQNQEANANQNVQHKASALDYNVNIGNAAGLDGATQRAKLQQDLANKLAELQSAQAQGASQGKKDSFSAALQLMGIDNNASAASGKAAQQDFENQLAAAKLQLEQAKAQGSSRTLSEALDQYNQIAQIASQAGIGNDPASFSAFLQNLKAAGSL